MNLENKTKPSLIIRSKFFISTLLLLLFLIYIYQSLILLDPLLTYDDLSLIQAIKSVSSLSNYISSIKLGFIPDLQPMRDLSYFLDLLLKKNIAFYTFHLGNLLWWLPSIYFFYVIIKNESNEDLAIALAFFFALSPIFASSVAWVAARKHLISTCFILAATALVVCKKKSIFSPGNFIFVSTLYLLSVLSQPINVLWPIWFALFTWQDLSKKKAHLVFLLFLMLTLVGINYFYYNSDLFARISAFGKFNSEGINPGLTFLALGRYFLLTIFPFGALPHSHYQGSYENILGLILFSMLSALLYFYPKQKKMNFYLAYLYFLLPLLIVTLKTTNVFCSDTYLLHSSVGMYWLLALYLRDNRHIRKIIFVIFIYAINCGIYSREYVKAFESDRDLWSYSYNKEANSHSTMMMALFHIKDKQFTLAYELIDKISQSWPTQPFLSQLSAEAIFFNDYLNLERKQELIEKISPQTPAIHFYLSVLYAQDNKPAQMHGHLGQIFKNPEQLRVEFWGREERVGAIYSYTCEFFNETDCLDVKSLKNNLSRGQFNEKLYNQYLENLSKNKRYKVDLKLY